LLSHSRGGGRDWAGKAPYQLGLVLERAGSGTSEADDRCGWPRAGFLNPSQPGARAEWLKKQDAVAGRVFCPRLLGLWRATEAPFLQAILDLAVPRMVQGRVHLVGDAAFIPRPHTAASTAKAGANALALGRVLQEFPDDVDAALKEWEADQLALGRDLERSGRALGNRSQFPQSKKSVL
jgi:2-polyprenyl-6-methoxyphenol hydroxylase-like FAD-dependent oxidoreductase